MYRPNEFARETYYTRASRMASTGVAIWTVCMYVCLSVTSRYCIKTAAGIQLAFGIQSSLDLSYTVFEGSYVYVQNKHTCL